MQQYWKMNLMFVVLFFFVCGTTANPQQQTQPASATADYLRECPADVINNPCSSERVGNGYCVYIADFGFAILNNLCEFRFADCFHRANCSYESLPIQVPFAYCQNPKTCQSPCNDNKQIPMCIEVNGSQCTTDFCYKRNYNCDLSLPEKSRAVLINMGECKDKSKCDPTKCSVLYPFGKYGAFASSVQ